VGYHCIHDPCQCSSLPSPVARCQAVLPSGHSTCFHTTTSLHPPLYLHYITDGATYSVTCNLSVTTSSAFATPTDQLRNPFQTVLNVTGTRTYVFLSTEASLTSTVTGLTRSGRFYPYSLLTSGPGVNSVPFLDYDRPAFTVVVPPIPADGVAPGSGTQYSVVEVVVNFSTPSSSVMLTENHYTQLPNPALQQQLYSTL
jgi:hypothetical protein